MALGATSFETIKQLMTAITSRPFQIVAVGYPDMLMSRAQVQELFGNDIAAAVQERADSQNIIKWHGLEGQLDRIIETEHFISLIGGQITFLDINKVRGNEIIQDLNKPLDTALAGKFDIVYDGGTLEHCFNIGQVMQNFLSLAKVGGFIYHNNPFNVPNHGFYNFNPTFYHDFYVDNGHTLVTDIVAYHGGPFDRKFVKLPATTRFKEALPESWISCVGRRMHDRAAEWPMQTKYKLNPHLSG